MINLDNEKFTSTFFQLVFPEHGIRVTRLGEFSPGGWLFTLGSCCENYSSSTNNWDTFFGSEIYVLSFKGYTLGDFSQSHLVTLHGIYWKIQAGIYL
jgi:hypothetical protein